MITGDTYDKRTVLKNTKPHGTRIRKAGMLKRIITNNLPTEECSINFSEADVDDYYFEEKVNNSSHGTADDGSVDSPSILVRNMHS